MDVYTESNNLLDHFKEAFDTRVTRRWRTFYSVFEPHEVAFIKEAKVTKCTREDYSIEVKQEAVRYAVQSICNYQD